MVKLNACLLLCVLRGTAPVAVHGALASSFLAGKILHCILYKQPVRLHVSDAINIVADGDKTGICSIAIHLYVTIVQWRIQNF